MSFITEEGLSEFVKLGRGTKQGDPLSPWLFSLVINVILMHWQQTKRGTTLLQGAITSLAFADDLQLVTENPEELRGMLKELSAWGKWTGFEVNPTKSVVWSDAFGEDKELEGIPIEKNEFGYYKYLGVYFQLNGGW